MDALALQIALHGVFILETSMLLRHAAVSLNLPTTTYYLTNTSFLNTPLREAFALVVDKLLEQTNLRMSKVESAWSSALGLA